MKYIRRDKHYIYVCRKLISDRTKLASVVYWPIPGRESIVDFALGGSEARTSVGTLR